MNAQTNCRAPPHHHHRHYPHIITEILGGRKKGVNLLTKNHRKLEWVSFGRTYATFDRVTRAQSRHGIKRSYSLDVDQM